MSDYETVSVAQRKSRWTEPAVLTNYELLLRAFFNVTGGKKNLLKTL